MNSRTPRSKSRENTISSDLVRTTLREIASKYIASLPEDLEIWGRSAVETERGYVHNHMDRFVRTFELISEVTTKEMNVLDVGIHAGYLAILVRRLIGCSVSGIDIKTPWFSHWKRRYDDNGIEVKPCDLSKERIPIPATQFDVVMFCEELEHLSVHPQFVLDEINRVSTPTAALVLSTPNIVSLPNRLMILTGKSPTRAEWGELGLGHFKLYTYDECITLLKEAGYRTERALFLNIEHSLKGKFILPMCKLVPSLGYYIAIRARKIAPGLVGLRGG
jgi:2-polyprenyl-3-methyl-5-hydroxy-6-metoxy-1,4-benzoquinol methylase